MTSTLTNRRRSLIVVMGVTGSGKSTLGPLLANALGAPFLDGDSLHSDANVAKMSAGVPLVDDDRWPWLDRIGQALANSGAAGLVVACSALRRGYRTEILKQAGDAIFVHLAGSAATLGSRLSMRGDHFMPESLLDSQLETLEPLQPGEPGLTVDIDQPIPDILRVALSELSSLQDQCASPPIDFVLQR